MSLKARITEDMKTAMRAKDSARLGAIRLLIAAIKQREIDSQTELDEPGVIGVIDKMIKQRRDSITQFEAGNRADLADIEKAEVAVLSAYLPQALSEAEIQAVIAEAIQASGAKSMQEMGKVMGLIRPKLAGRADMGQVSALIKTALSQ